MRKANIGALVLGASLLALSCGEGDAVLAEQQDALNNPSIACNLPPPGTTPGPNFVASVYVCHTPKNDPTHPQTVRVPAKDAATRLLQGDKLGPCPQ